MNLFSYENFHTSKGVGHDEGVDMEDDWDSCGETIHFLLFFSTPVDPKFFSLNHSILLLTH